MSDLYTAAENIRRFAKQFEGIIAVAETLESIGKFEQITEEQKGQAAAAQAEADAAKAEVAKAKAAIAKAKEQATEVADAAIRAAETSAASIVRTAEESAAEIVKKAQDEGAKLIEKAATEKARMSSEIGGLQRAIEAARDELVMLNADKANAEAAAADAEKRLAAVKGKLKDLLV